MKSNDPKDNSLLVELLAIQAQARIQHRETVAEYVRMGNYFPVDNLPPADSSPLGGSAPVITQPENFWPL